MVKYPEVEYPAFEVTLVSGEALQVQSEVEQRWFNRAKNFYAEQTRFSEHTDLADLDRLLCMELLDFRWNQHLAAGQDYEGDVVDVESLRRNLKDQTKSINDLKQAMGLAKAARNAALDSGNFTMAWTDLKKRAKEFGVHREEQLRKALVLMNELSAVVGSYDRSDLAERKKLGYETEAEILDWVREYLLPEFKKIDEYFRTHKQRFWSRESL